MTEGPPLVDILQIMGAGGLAIGGIIGLLLPAADVRQLAQSFLLWSAVGTFVGVCLGFAWAAAIAVNGGVG